LKVDLSLGNVEENQISLDLVADVASGNEIGRSVVLCIGVGKTMVKVDLDDNGQPLAMPNRLKNDPAIEAPTVLCSEDVSPLGLCRRPTELGA
jgi:hypothetical protein